MAKTKPTSRFVLTLERLAAAYRIELTDDQRRVYFDALSDVDAPRMDAAVDAAVRTCQWFPKPAELRRIANDLGDKPARFVNGERVYDCQHCQDGGTLTVWSPQTVRALFDGREANYQTCVVACICQAGDRWARERVLAGKTWHALPRFDEKRMRRPQCVLSGPESDYQPVLCYSGSSASTKADLAEWVQTLRRVENHPNYTDFGEYSHERQGAF